MPTARNGVAAASINGIVYAVGGGGNSCNPFATLEAYDPTTNSWTTKTSMPTPRYNLAAVSVNQILYAIGGGGFCSDSGDQAANEAYDPTTDSWTIKAPMPVATRDLSVDVVNGKIYVVGGTYSSAVYAYDPVADVWTTEGAVTPYVESGNTGAVNGIIYRAGGSSSQVNAYNPVSDSWTVRASSIPTSRFNPGVGVVDSIIYFVGGNCTAETDGYDPATDTWTIETTMPTLRQPGVAVANGVLYALGGHNCTDYQAQGTNEAYTPTPPPAATQIANLIATIQNLNLPQGTTTSLTSKLQSALNGLASGSVSSCNVLNAFINQVYALSGKQLTVAEANSQIASANQIKTAEGCP